MNIPHRSTCLNRLALFSLLFALVLAPALRAQSSPEQADKRSQATAVLVEEPSALEKEPSAQAQEPSAQAQEPLALEQEPLAQQKEPSAQEQAPPAEQQPLSLLGDSIEPGSSKILTWALESGFSDVSAPASVLVVNGLQPGPTMCLTAAVHGDELNGIEIVRRVVYELDAQKLSGAVIAVPIVNLEGFKRATRYLPDRRDLNRYFPGRANGSFASRIAFSFFGEVISHCDFLIDVHTGSLDRTNLPQIRANLTDEKVADLAGRMGSIVVLQSNGRVGTLRRAATDAGIPAVTFETGAPNNLQKKAVEEGVKTINAALRSLGLTAASFWLRSKEPIYYRSRWIRASQGGILFSKVALGDSVKEGTVLGLLSNPITNKTAEVISTMEGRVIGMALNQIVYPGYAAYHIGLKSSAVEASEPMDESDLEKDIAVEQLPSPDLPASLPAANAPIVDSQEPSATVSDDSGVEEATTIEEMELPTAKEKN